MNKSVKRVNMLNKVNDKLIDVKSNVREAMFDKKLELISMDGKESAKKTLTSIGTFVITKNIFKKLF